MPNGRNYWLQEELIPEPEGSQAPDGYTWDNTKGRYVNVDTELRQPLLRLVHGVLNTAKAVFPPGWRELTMAEFIFTSFIRSWPDELWSAGAHPSLLMYAPDGSGRPGAPAGVHRTVAQDAGIDRRDAVHTFNQLNALIDAHYDQVGLNTTKVPLLRGVLEILMGLCASMVEPVQASWPAFYSEKTQSYHDTVEVLTLRGAWSAAAPYTIEGRELMKAEVGTALAGKLMPWLEHSVSTIGGTEKVDTFRLLMTFINIVASRYELTSDPGSN